MGKNVKIGLCDDNIIAIEELKILIKEYLKEKKIEAVFFSFSDAKKVLSNKDELDILFLDIDMPEKDGIQLGVELRKRGSQCRIIVASGREDRFKETYLFSPFRFASKPFQKKEIEEYLDDVWKTFLGKNKVLFYFSRIPYYIEEIHIEYIRAYNGYTEAKIKGKSQLMRKETSLGKLQKELDVRLFYRVNREYLVIFFYIEDYKLETVFISGLEIKISRRNRTEFEKRLQAFDLKYRG